ncbi:MAG: TetR/AcrR family transcriptional regulator C-terminal domain-containing protein [Solobacterium sp.]|nr:TetR/AcrR family transcriptional regulator C-terminal domain-containing protein [Solobacterium sp.]
MIKKRTSKEYLLESALELLSKDDIELITVHDITSNCNISPRTFYNYFSDKYELANSVYLYLIEQYYVTQNQPLTLHDLLMLNAQCMYDNRPFFRNLIQYVGQNNFRHFIHKPLKEKYLEVIRTTFHIEPDEHLSEDISFFLYGCIGSSEMNFSTPNIQRPEQIIPIYERCMPDSLKPFL